MQGVPPHGSTTHGYNASRKTGSSLKFFILLFLLAPISRAAPVTTTLVPALGWDIKKQGGFPVSLASDPSGDIWVGTEGNGLWKYDPSKKSWTQFTESDGLGDDSVYALAFDRQGRLWAGHLNHGVSVYNGAQWRNYGILDGPLGDRVFSIAVSPIDGDVWIATDMGLARYSEKRQDWDYYTRACGLPSDQIQSIAFDGKGAFYAGTQCNGIAIAQPKDNYTKWDTLSASPPASQTPVGAGLASNLINQVVPAHGLAMMAALTPFGASLTLDGEGWQFVRGNDWKRDKSLPPPNLAGQRLPPLLAEDWITALCCEKAKVWFGYRRSGIESRAIDGDGAIILEANVPKGSVFIRAILALPSQPVLIAAYDEAAGGLLTLANATPATSGSSPSTTGKPSAALLQPLAFSLQRSPLPAPAPPPTLDDARALSVRLGRLTQQLLPGEAWYLADDWRTEGDWIGRYGNAYIKLCGMAQGDQDYALQPGYEVTMGVGPHHEANAAGPVWYHGDDSSDDLRTLYDPVLGHRRDAEDNDFSYDTKTYPESYDGPDLWVRAKVPDGVHCLSLYFVNNDAHTRGGTKYRDYDVQLLSGADDPARVQAEPFLARTRVTDFWGGVYKQFLVCGPADYVVRIGRNRSNVTKLQGVFVDRVAPEPVDPPARLPGFDDAPYDPPDTPTDFNPTPLADAAVNLWGQLDDALSLRGAIPLQMPLHIWCYRAAAAGQAPAAVLERFRWEISLWTPEDRKKYDDAMKAAHAAVR
jgi:hypothetical protein